MNNTIMLYGATGFSGGLIAAEAESEGLAGTRGSGQRMVLAGRDRDRLRDLAKKHHMEYRAFGLDDRAEVNRNLAGVDVLLNAAGPFALTANRLAKAAIEAGCHYVDINGEADVYKKLDDLGYYAVQRDCSVVCSAGHTSAASDLLLHAALEQLSGQPERELGTIRIAMSRIVNLSRGSAETLWRAMREQVTVVRLREEETAGGGKTRKQVLWHEPVGKLERTFDFQEYRKGARLVKPDLRIGSAANLVDTLTARLTVERNKFSMHGIESYVETGHVARLGYQLGTFLAPVAAIPWVRQLARAQLSLLPEGPTEQELNDERHTILLDIEDPLGTRIVDWRWETPNAYQFTAQVALEVARRVMDDGAKRGWVTPAGILLANKTDLLEKNEDGYLRGCRLNERVSKAYGGV